MPRSPLYRRIADDLRRAIASGKLPRGARLPSSREFARQLGVSRNTVLAAYEALAADGILKGRTGSGTTVRNSPAVRFDARALLRDAQFPVDAVQFRDSEGNDVYLHR